MTIFPRLEPKYYVEGDYHLQKMMNEAYAEMISINISFWSEADIDSRFRANDQTLWADIYGNLPAYRRRDFNFNIINSPCNMITGYQRQHRKQVITNATAPMHEQAAGQFSKALVWSNNFSKFHSIYSQACDGATTTGMNLLHCWMDYSNDPINGDIRWDNLSYNTFLIDPYFRKLDLSDCNKIWVRKYVTKEQACMIFPERHDEIMQMEGSYNKDGKFQFIPESYNYAMRKLLILDEYWYLDSRSQKILVDTTTGETMEWKGSMDRANEFVRDFPHVQMIDSTIPSTKLAMMLNGGTMYHGPNPMGIDKFPFVVVPFYYDPQIPYYPQRIRGLVRDMRDTQYLFNRNLIISLDICESTINSGWKYKENALVNPNDIFLTGQGKGLAMKDEAQMDDAIKIEPSAPRPEFMQLGKDLQALIPRITGINEELLGQSNDDISGLLASLRQSGSLITLQKVFDQWDDALIQCGEIEIDLMQANWTPGKVRRIVNEEPAQEFYNKNFGKYDCAVVEAANTPTQRKLALQQTVFMKSTLGMNIPDDYILDLSDLQDKDKLKERMAKDAQAQQQMQMMAQQAQIAESQAKAEDMHAKAVANQGLGYERASRIAENQALATERRAAAIRDVQSGNLDQIRAAKELQSMDLDQLAKAIEILKALQQDNLETAEAAGNAQTA